MTLTRKKNHSKKDRIVNTIKNRTFTDDDYKSGDGMLTSVWGPSLWHTLHTISFNYPIEPTLKDKTHYMNFILSLKYVLPCKYCRKNLKKNLKSLPLTLEQMKSRETFSKYLYELHEHINMMLNKKSHLSYQDVRERYEHFRSRCTNKKNMSLSSLLKKQGMGTRKTNKNNKKTQSKKEKGCITPLYGKKSRCIIKIVPQEHKGQSLQIDKKCIKKPIK